MSFVTDEMRKFVKTVSRGLVATIDENGNPHVSVKNGRLNKDGSLELWGVFGDDTVRNIERNSSICVAFANFDKAWGYRFKGKGAVVTSGERFEKVRGNLENMGWTLKELIRIEVDNITLISQEQGEINKMIFDA